MKTYFILLISLFLFNFAVAQVEKGNYKLVSTKLVSFLNENKTDYSPIKGDKISNK